MGPIGSGKSVGCCFEIFIRACQQAPNQDGIRKSRVLIVRNTLPQLETTTMKTWKDWFPPGDPANGFFGKMTGKPPYTHYLEFSPVDPETGKPDGTKVDLEVQFIALDKPEDVKKLLSYECSGIWFNEAREINKDLIDAATGRVGRYPSPKDGGCTHKYIIMDTNPPDDSHWWYHLAEVETPSNWAFFRQPSGLDRDAENLENLNQPRNWRELSVDLRRDHGRGYYHDMLGGKTQEWIDVYVHGNYGFIKQGAPVYGKAWNGDFHVAKEPIRINPVGEIIVGVDASGRHPAAAFFQQTARGQIQLVHELCITDDDGMGAVQFSALLRREMVQKFKQNVIVDIWADPAGFWKSQNDERTYADILRAQGVRCKPSPGLRFSDRKEAMIGVFGKMVDGQPALIVSPTCKHFIRGCNGGYMFRQISTSGEARYDDTKPFKNRYSDIQDAAQYAVCGMGVLQDIRRAKNHTPKNSLVDTSFSLFGSSEQTLGEEIGI